jgi:hypothetical protein
LGAPGGGPPAARAAANAASRAVLQTLARYGLSNDNDFGLPIERLDTKPY